MFRRVEICTYQHKTDKIGNQAHADFLQWERVHVHLIGYGVRLSHDKTQVDFSSDEAWEIWKKTWKNYYRRIY